MSTEATCFENVIGLIQANEATDQSQSTNGR